MVTSCSATYFLEVGAHFSLKVTTKVLLDTKVLRKFRFLGYFSKAKPEGCNQEDWSASDKFGIITLCSATYYLVVGAPVSLKVATKACFRVKQF